MRTSRYIIFGVLYTLVVISCGGSDPTMEQPSDTSVLPGSFSATISGTFSDLSSKDIAWGTCGVLYSLDNKDAVDAFNSWKEGNDNPDCNRMDNVNIMSGGVLSTVISGLEPEKDYCYCLYFKSEKGNRRISGVGKFRTKTFNGSIVEVKIDDVKYYSSTLTGKLRDINENDIASCVIGFKVAEKNEDLDNAELKKATINDDGTIELNLKGLVNNTVYCIQPQVSLCDNRILFVGTSLAFQTKSVDEMAIDLGLSVKWASCDFGAQDPMEDGECFAWGDLSPNHKGSLESYAYYVNGSYVNIGDEISGTEYDVVHMTFGGKWRMPTIQEVEELYNNCSVGLEGDSNDNMKINFSVKDNTGKRMILRVHSKEYWNGKASNGTGLRWTGSMVEGYVDKVYSFQPNTSFVSSWIDRFTSKPIRPVCDY